MKEYLIFLGSLLISLTFISVVQAQESLQAFDTIKLCQQAKQFKCEGYCKDGWGTYCYYDHSNYIIENNRSLDSQKNKCYGFYDSSICTPCRNNFEIGNKPVTCEEFYDSLNSKNKECHGCLRSAMNAGG